MLFLGRELDAGEDRTPCSPTLYRFDVGRHPNPHVTFGRGGPHFCLGSFLASLAIRILLEEILARNVRFELTGPPVRLSSNFINGFNSLPVRVVDAR